MTPNSVSLPGIAWAEPQACIYCGNVSRWHDREECQKAYVATLRSLQRQAPRWFKQEEK